MALGTWLARGAGFEQFTGLGIKKQLHFLTGGINHHKFIDKSAVLLLQFDIQDAQSLGRRQIFKNSGKRYDPATDNRLAGTLMVFVILGGFRHARRRRNEQRPQSSTSDPVIHSVIQADRR